MGKNNVLKCYLIKNYAEFGSKVLFFEYQAGLLGIFTLDLSHIK